MVKAKKEKEFVFPVVIKKPQKKKKKPIKKKFDKVNLEDSYNNDRLEDKKPIITNAPILIQSVGKLQDITKMMSEISQHELGAAEVLYDVITHVWKTYGDKYQSEVTDWLDTKALLLSKNGKYANIHNASKYIQRYSTTGFEKSENIQDCMKAIHYLIFEIQRRKSEQTEK
jgi:hypothetical protein